MKSRAPSPKPTTMAVLRPTNTVKPKVTSSTTASPREERISVQKLVLVGHRPADDDQNARQAGQRM